MYGWIIPFFDGAAGGDYTKWKELGEMNCIDSLNMIQYQIVKAEDEELRRKKK